MILHSKQKAQIKTANLNLRRKEHLDSLGKPLEKIDRQRKISLDQKAATNFQKVGTHDSS